MLTGFHEPRASHLDLLGAITDSEVLRRCYAEAVAHGYRWHEFGDVNLLLPGRPNDPDRAPVTLAVRTSGECYKQVNSENTMM